MKTMTGLFILLLARSAWAIGLPDSSQCTDTSHCLSITNNNTGTSAVGVRGQVSGAGAGIVGTSFAGGYGVFGGSSTGPGVFGTSTGGDGMEAKTTAANRSALYAHHDGISNFGYGVYALAGGSNIALFGNNPDPTGWAVVANGKLLAGSGYKPGGGSWTSSSDARLKKDIQPLDGALEKLLALKGVSFEWKDPASQGNLTGTQTGFIAQDVEKVFPGWVGTDEKGYKTVTVRGFEALSVEATRELAGRVKRLELGVLLLLAVAGALAYLLTRRWNA